MPGTVELVDWTAQYASRYLLAAVRVLAALGINPLFGSARVPMLARVGVGLLVTFLLFPPVGTPLSSSAPSAEVGAFGGTGSLSTQHSALSTPSVTPITIAGELLVGLLAGFTVVLIFGAVQFAGSLIGMTGGFQFGATVDPAHNMGTNALDQLFYALALLAFVQINGHHLFLLGLHELFATVPVGTVTLAAQGSEHLAAAGAALFSAAVKMAFPVLAALLIADLGLAVLARVAPQLNLFVVGLPLKMLVALGALLVALPVMLPRLNALFRALPQAMQALVG